MAGHEAHSEGYERNAEVCGEAVADQVSRGELLARRAHENDETHETLLSTVLRPKLCCFLRTVRAATKALIADDLHHLAAAQQRSSVYKSGNSCQIFISHFKFMKGFGCSF